MSVTAPKPADNKPVDQNPPPQQLADAPQPYRVQRGDTVTDIAHRYGTSVDAIVKANPQKLKDPSRLLAGDVLTLPAKPAATAKPNAAAASPDAPQKSPEQQRTDQAVADLKTLSAPGQPRDKGRTDDIAAAQGRLDDAVDAEVKARVNAPFEPGLTPQQRKQLGETKPPTTEIAAQARADIVARYANEPGAAAGVQKAVDTQEATSLVADNDRAGYTSPRDKLIALDGALGRASSQSVRDIAAAQPGYAKTVQAAADWAGQPYDGVADSDLKGAGQQAQDASQRVSDLMGGVSSPTLRAQLVADTKPTLDKALQFASDGRGDHALQAATAFGNVSNVVGALRQNDPAAATSLANQLAGRYADQFKNMAGVIVPPRDAMAYAVSKGADPTLALSVADKLAAGETNLPKDPRPNGIKTPSEQTKQAVLDGVARYGQEVDKDLKAYTDQTGELNSLIAKEGANATPDQINKAIDNYKALKGPAWEQKTQAAFAKLGDDGKKLLAQQAVLGNYVNTHPNDQKAVGDTLNKVFSDPANQAAIRVAVQNNPALIQGGDGKSLMGLYAQVGKSLDQGGRKLVQELGENYVKGRVDTLRQGLRSGDTASLRTTLDEIDKLGNDKALPTVLGVSDGKQVDLKAATDALKDNVSKNYSLGSLPQDPKAVVAATQKNLGELDGKLSGIKAFDKGSALGASFRLFSVAAAGLSVASAYQKAGTGANTEEQVRNDLSLLVSSAGFTQKTAGLVNHIGLTDSSSTAGKIIKEVGARTVDRVINGLSGAIDLWKAGDAFLSPNGDKVEGALYATTGAGSLLWAFGTGSWAGPVGIGLVAVGTIGLIKYQDAKANTDAQPGREAFLKGENFNDSAAKALAQRHSDGDASPVPMLMRYGQLHGLDAAQTTAWFNGLNSEQQTFFAGALAKAQDSVGGDPAKFGATASGDGDLDRHANDYQDLSEGWTGSVFGTVPTILIAQVDGPNQEVTPGSAHQLDAILSQVLKAKPPGTP